MLAPYTMDCVLGCVFNPGMCGYLILLGEHSLSLTPPLLQLGELMEGSPEPISVRPRFLCVQLLGVETGLGWLVGAIQE